MNPKNYSLGIYIKNNYAVLSNHMIFKRTKNKKYSSNVMNKIYFGFFHVISFSQSIF